MEAARNIDKLQIFNATKLQHVQTGDLLAAFHHYANNIQVLSLDCFDTLLWRKTMHPKDLFFDLQNLPHSKAAGIFAINRIDAESNARSFANIRHGHFEVTLQDIYRTGFPSLTDDAIAAIIEEEIQAEIAACYAYPATVAIMRAAMAAGIKIIIVSNTYLLESQLRRLLSSALPDDVMAAIDTIFCSCEYKQSKSEKLFAEVLSQLKLKPDAILHIGDNQLADLDSPKQYGMQAMHLVQFSKKLAEFFRLQATAATITDPAIHSTRSMVSPFRGILSYAKHATQRPESIIGYLSMGPIMYTFARYLCDEVAQLKREGKRPKVLFMLRDAHLPYLACEALQGTPIGKCIRISRFSALAASFRSRKNIEEFLLSNAEPGFLPVACRQLLLSDLYTKQLIQQAEKTANPEKTFFQLILQEENVAYIIEQSKKYWERFKKYLLQVENIQAGDTVVMVDLGYAGRTQHYITPVLESELGVTVTGRYLIALNTLEWQLSRKGLIDPSWCDDRVAQMICLGNPLLEELCCSADNSVENYDEHGNPIFTASSAKTSQRDKTRLIQNECIQFIHDAKHFFQTAGGDLPLTMLRDAALAELTRRTYFPLTEEIDYLQDHQHDENRGTDLASSAFNNPEKELIHLHQHGLSFINQDPYGLRSAGLELSIGLMAKIRYGFDLELDDMSLRRENVAVITMKNQTMEKNVIQAAPTYDGFYSLWFVVDNQNVNIAILFGINYQALQIEHVDLIHAKHFYKSTEKLYTQNIRSKMISNEMIAKDNSFFECTTTTSALIIPLETNSIDDRQYVVRVIYRPVVKRQ